MIKKGVMDCILGFSSEGWILSSHSLFPKEIKYACNKGMLMYFTAIEDAEAVKDLYISENQFMHLVPLTFEVAMSISHTIPNTSGILVLDKEPIVIGHNYNTITL